MRDDLSNFEEILPPERLERLRHIGVFVFDVDDTLLARRSESSERDQVFSESPAAVAIPLLLKVGVRVCIITGHGGSQLKRRFIRPLAEEVTRQFSEKRDELLQRLFVYANRGATKLVWKNGDFAEDKDFGCEFSFDPADLICLREIFGQLAKSFNEDFARQKDLYREHFSEFPFDELPPKILERENVVLGLRPIPSEAHGREEVSEVPRRKLFSLGCRLVQKGDLDAKYTLLQSGKSTLEITKKAVSKKIAFQDMLSQISRDQNISLETVEEATIYVGDEFSPTGNDYVISQSFPHCLCLSVTSAERQNITANVIFLDDFFQLEGVPATTGLISYTLNFLTKI